MLNLTLDFMVQERTDETAYGILVEEGCKEKKGLVRVFIPTYPHGNFEEPGLSHEFFLNADECHVFGSHLLAVSERLRISEKGE